MDRLTVLVPGVTFALAIPSSCPLVVLELERPIYRGVLRLPDAANAGPITVAILGQVADFYVRTERAYGLRGVPTRLTGSAALQFTLLLDGEYPEWTTERVPILPAPVPPAPPGNYVPPSLTRSAFDLRTGSVGLL